MFRRRLFTLLLGTLLLGLLTIALFPRQTFETFAMLKFKSIVKKELSAHLQSGKLYWHEGKFYLEEAHIVSSNNFALTIDCATYSFDKKLSIEGAKFRFFQKSGIGIEKVADFLFHSPVTTTLVNASFLFPGIHGREETVICHFSKESCVLSFEDESLKANFSIGPDHELKIVTKFGMRNMAPLCSFAHFFLIGDQNPFSSWELTQGEAQIDLEATLQGGKFISLKGTNHFKEIVAKNSASDFLFTLQEAASDFSSFSFKEAAFVLTGKKREIFNGISDLFSSYGHFVVKDGQVIDSKVQLKFCGLEGLCTLVSTDLLKIDFFGSAESVRQRCPPKFREAFQNAFTGDQFNLRATLSKTMGGIDLQGNLEILSKNASKHQLFFGTHLGKQKSAQKSTLSLQCLRDYLCIEKPLGWFSAQNFPLEKFFSPFLFAGKNMHLNGLIDFEGTFDDTLIAFFYRGKEFRLDTPQFNMACHHVKNACHYINLSDFDHLGMLPLEGAIYTQKNQGFTLADASLVAYFSKDNIAIEEIKTHFEDLTFSGEVNLQKQKDQTIDLWIKTSKAEGSIASTSNFLKKCIPGYNLTIPFEGNVVSNQDGVALHFSGSKLVNACVVGSLSAAYKTDYFQFSDYKVAFDYDLKKNRLAFLEGKGMFNINSLCYEVSTPLISFHDFPYPQLAIEMSVKKGAKDLFHLIGRTENFEGKRDIIIEGDQFKLTAIQDAGRFVIDQFYVGSAFGKADIDVADSVLKVSNFEIQSKELGVLTFTGEYDAKKSVFRAEVPRLTLDLNKFFFNTPLPGSLKEWSALWHPRGQLFGELNLSFDFANKSFLAKSVSTFSNLGLAGIDFGAGKNLQWQFSSKDGLIVEGLEVNLPETEGQYRLGKFHYDLKSQKIKFDDFDFSLPKERIPFLGSLAMRLFPEKFPKEMIEWAEKLKENEPLEGKVSLELSPDKVWAYLTLRNGIYHIFDKKYDIRNFALTLSPEGVNFAAASFVKDVPIFFSVFSPGRSLEAGSIFVKENIGSINGLQGHWKRGEGNQIQLVSVEGKSFGIEAHLHERQKNILNGYLFIDCGKCAAFFPESVRKKVEDYSIGDGYSLAGDFAYSLQEGNFAFIGKMIGSNFSLGKMRLGSLRADLVFSDHLIEVDNFSILDWGGKLDMPKLRCTKESGVWKLQIPKITMEDVRLSRLKEASISGNRKNKKSYFKHLNIESFVATDIEGRLGDLPSFKGMGNLKFTNLNRKTFFSNLLFLPSELTARIGLDLSLLVPAQGQISYEIGKGRINLLKFKKMYSEGKRSRFYLAEGHEPYIDFNGNLNLKVKMKQYNLLMKLAEFFVVTVRGNIFKPIYSFTNNYDSIDVVDEE